ncbi:Putative thiosulfate sulfurtransferase SseB [Capillimicrobium parvum]|uniref:Thiosulfate sulfurtransferase SseB n=1 Tax=Capillimicrobium parvum TaxID=2884022 RepID=A0A9E6Y0X0_9ACTN|nr:Putative thiosulfate sulfurtransferase SseB [Capillimicrobium parvum]
MVADVRWYLDGRSGRAAYDAGHIPGAVWVDLDTVLAGPPSPERGRHPLPDPERFAAGLAALGVGDDDTVVAYDDAGGSVAARLVWLLRAIGGRAAVLDGGLAAWPGALETAPARRPPAARAVVAWPADRLAEAGEVAAAGVPVLDARAPERYRGETEPIDPRPGHIPGAANVPWASTLDEAGRFRPAETLQSQFAAAGVRPGAAEAPIAYCGSGVTACHVLLALEAAGLGPGRLYPGSWSQWSANPERPVATGS